MALLQR